MSHLQRREIQPAVWISIISAISLLCILGFSIVVFCCVCKKQRQREKRQRQLQDEHRPFVPPLANQYNNQYNQQYPNQSQYSTVPYNYESSGPIELQGGMAPQPQQLDGYSASVSHGASPYRTWRTNDSQAQFDNSKPTELPSAVPGTKGT